MRRPEGGRYKSKGDSHFPLVMREKGAGRLGTLKTASLSSIQRRS
jgi:hypothetical protein